MLLYQIIQTNETGKDSILIELLSQYRKSLYTYYKDLFCCEPVLMVTDVFNAAQYGIIVPSNDFSEAIEHYLNDSDLNEEDKTNEIELINFQSIMMKDFIK